ncbi:MAG: hypothetical protein HKN43_06545 [Rhodothermales bacterium]|nr:hypothetical protein [Rhodothermales bacterium]
MTKSVLLFLMLTAGTTVSAQNYQSAYSLIEGDASIEYIKTSLDHALSSLDEQTARWKSRFSDLEGTNIVRELVGYQPPTFLVNIADVSSYLYEVTGESSYAVTTRDLLVSMNEFREFFPEEFQTREEYKDGIPAVNWFRALPVYVEAFMRTQQSGVYSAADMASIEDAVESSAEIVFKFPEWGPMNRAMLRAESLLAASLAFPEHPRSGTWRKMAEILASDTIGKWEIEDASVYHPIWLHAYVNYVDLSGRQSAFESPMMKFYFDYFVELLTPAGTMPEFGDGLWKMNLSEYIVLLERGAREYQDPEMKWAALRMMESMKVLQGNENAFTAGAALEEPSIGLARLLIRRNEWGDADVVPQKPTMRSGDAMDDVIAKKIVMRSGWDPDATYLMLNYKDEGFEGIMPKNYLKQILAVEEEKMHHGQSDENGISMFMRAGTVLLSDGGYRPEAPSGPYGAYRSDIFHNRVVVRDRRKGIGQDYFEIFRDSGAYNESVRTAKIDYQDFPEFEYSRTRLDDRRTGYTGDRILVRDKKEDFVIVVDVVKFNESKYYTAAALWHTRTIVDHGDTWFHTRIDSLMGQHANPGDNKLLIVMPGSKDSGTVGQDRAMQDEIAIYNGTSQYFAAGSVASFVTILVPTDRESDAESYIDRFRLIKQDEQAVTVQVDGTRSFGIKLDLDRDVLTEDIRPRYNYESGMIEYGTHTTDADFSYVSTASENLRWAATNLVRIDVNGTTLFDAPSSQFFQVWGRSDHVGRAKWRRWDNYDE